MSKFWPLKGDENKGEPKWDQAPDADPETFTLTASIFNCEVGRRLHLATFQKEVLT